MTNTQQTTDEQKAQQLTEKLDALLGEVKKVNKDIEETNKQAKQGIKEINDEVDASVNNANEIFANLDKIENEAADKMDALSLKIAEDLASEK